MFASRFGRRVWQGRPVRYACRGYWPCGASPRLRMPLGNGCAKQCISILAYRSFCRLDLEGKMPDHSTFSKNAMVAFVKAMLPATHRVVPLKSCVGPIDRNQPRPPIFLLANWRGPAPETADNSMLRLKTRRLS